MKADTKLRSFGPRAAQSGWGGQKGEGARYSRKVFGFGVYVPAAAESNEQKKEVDFIDLRLLKLSALRFSRSNASFYPKPWS